MSAIEQPNEMPNPQIVRANLHLFEPVSSEKLGTARGISVWLPPSYGILSNNRYPTLYFQDGSFVLDSDTRCGDLKAGADSWVEELVRQKLIPEVIIIAIDAVESRDQEYSPAIRGDGYADFIINVVKPRIDQIYRTDPGPENTAIAGWSLGAFVALFIAWKRPDVFGKVACLSPCFFDCPTHDDADMVLRTYQQMIWANDFNPSLRLYFDYGTDEHLDGDISQPGPGQTEALLKTLERNGLRQGENYEFHMEQSAKHAVEDWRKRLYRPLCYLFPHT